MANFWLVINGGTTEEFSSITDAQVAAKGYVNQHIDVELHVNTTLTEEMALNATTSDFGGIPVYFEQGCGDTKRFDAFRIETGTTTGDISVTTNGGSFGGRLQGGMGINNDTSIGPKSNTSIIDGSVTLTANGTTFNDWIVNNVSAYVKGDSITTITGGTAKSNIYGGNYGSEVLGDVRLTFTDVKIAKSAIIYCANRTRIGGTLSAQAVRITGGTIFGQISTDASYAKFTQCKGVDITVTDSTLTWICCGYNESKVVEEIVLNVSGSTITGSNTNARFGAILGFFYSVANNGVHITISDSVLKSFVVGGDRNGTSSYVSSGDVSISIANSTGTTVYGTRKYVAAKKVSIDLNNAKLSGNVILLEDGGTATSTELNIGGTTSFVGDLAGGGTGNSKVNGTATVNITGGTVNGSVYGGGVSGADVSGTATISITGGVFGNSSRVFGGGKLSVAGNNAGVYHQASNVTMTAAASKVQRLAGGAQITAALEGGYTLSGDTKVTLTAGTVTQAIAGRANTAIGTAVTDGDGSALSIIDISGGWAHIVAGAGLVTKADASYSYNGDTLINVTGGTIDYLFGGNVGSKKEFCGGTEMIGDVSITIDTSAKTVNLKYLYAGSNSSTGYEAAQEGNTTVTFTGDGANLIWTEGGVSGDGSGKFADIDKSQGYSRTLCFNGFTGVFAAPQISRFDTIAFAGSSDVSFGSAALKLGGVETWQFGLGSSLTWNDGTNSFANDALIFGEAGDNISTDWEVMTSNNNKVFAGWGRANIMLFGIALDTYDEDTLTWSAEGFGYEATWDDEHHKIIIAQA